MSSIQELFQQAQLSEAAYANFLNSSGNLLENEDDIKVALIASGFSKDSNNPTQSAQATAFVADWEVISHIPDTAAGFSATIFKNKATGAYSLAIRGSTDFTDFSVDAALIAVDGIAVRQLIDLYNFWNRSTTTAGQTYAIAQVALYDSFGNLPAGAIPVGSSPYGILLGDSSQLPDAALRLATGAIPVGLGAINVNGHSLGGHLAMAFTRLFPNIASTASVANALGFKIGNSTVDSLFSILGGASTFNAPSILNVYGIAGPEFAAMNNSVLQQPGGYEGIYIENGSLISPPVAGHSSVQMTDSAAVYDLFIKLSAQIRNSTPTAALATLKPLFEASSNQAESSLERVVDALVNLFGLDFPPLVGSLNNNRDELYKRIVPLQAITKNLSNNNPGMHVDVLATSSTSAESLALLASGSTALAYRYALKELNPFAIVGDNTLYAPHNTGANAGKLDLYNATATVRTGALTSEWIADRAAFLAWKNIANTADVTALASTQTTEMSRFIDLPQQINLSVIPQGPGLPSVPQDEFTRRFIFGGDGIEVLTGGNKSDRLYGGGGIDYLAGKKEIDYLEGGAGRDVYEYNGYTSPDSPNDGADLIRDTDGRGVLRYLWNGNPAPISTAIADASVKVSATEWTSADGKFRYVKSTNAENATDLTITILADGGGTMVLKDFRDGDFGIKLGTRTAQTTITTSGGAGRNTLEGSASNELFEGNADGTTPSVGGDFIYGRAGDDDLYGNAKTTLQSAITPLGADAVPTGLRGDWLNGGTGDDYVIGYTGNDVVLGGLGADLLVGGAGDDTLAGDTDYTSLQTDWTVTQGMNVFFRTVGVINDENSNEPLLSGGADVLYGGLGSDFINGEVGDDLLFGEQGNDILAGGYGSDVLVGGADNDNLTGDFGVRATIDNVPIAHGDDYLDGGAGLDWLQGEGGNDILLGGSQATPGVRASIIFMNARP